MYILYIYIIYIYIYNISVNKTVEDNMSKYFLEM